jgi:outer membrane protein assembly factor BamD (BamD/ComL family)
MKRNTLRVCLVLLAAMALLVGCASTPAELPQGLSVAEIFQRAQEAVDANDFAIAIRYYSLAQTTYPDDVTHGIWASYEIAFLNHKQGNDANALSLINAMLATYDGKWDTLPPETAAPRVLAENLKARLETLTTKKQ